MSLLALAMSAAMGLAAIFSGNVPLAGVFAFCFVVTLAEAVEKHQ